MNDDGQAYIATAVALGALLVGAFAAPAITNASLGASYQEDAAQRQFLDEVDDVLRFLEKATSGMRPHVVSECTSTVIPPPPDSGLPPTITWDCNAASSCGEESLIAAIDENLTALRPHLRAAVIAGVSAQPGCEATCRSGTYAAIEQIPADVAHVSIDLRLWFTAPAQQASLHETAFGGPRFVDITCVDVT